MRDVSDHGTKSPSGCLNHGSKTGTKQVSIGRATNPPPTGNEPAGGSLHSVDRRKKVFHVKTTHGMQQFSPACPGRRGQDPAGRFLIGVRRHARLTPCSP